MRAPLSLPAPFSLLLALILGLAAGLASCGSDLVETQGPDPVVSEQGLVLLEEAIDWNRASGSESEDSEAVLEDGVIGVPGGVTLGAASAPSPTAQPMLEARNQLEDLGYDGAPDPTHAPFDSDALVEDETILIEGAAGGRLPDAPAERAREGGEAAKEAESGEELTTWQRATSKPNATALKVGSDAELPLTGAQVSAWVEGHRARVVLDLFFFNDREQGLEGSFKLRLPEGASPYYFAFGGVAYGDGLDLDSEEVLRAPDFFDAAARQGLGNRPDSIFEDRAGRWQGAKEARMVPRAKAAQAYLDTVRQNIDPALLEWSGAGVFSARVFPLEARRLSRVVVAYEQDLTRLGEDWQFQLELPEDAPAVNVDLFVAVPGGASAVVTNAGDPVRSAGREHYSWTDPADRSFAVKVEGAGVTALATPGSFGEDYFALAFRPDVAGEEVAGRERGVLLIDTSLTSAPERFAIWLDLAAALLARNEADLREFAVLFFDVDAHWWRAGFTPNTRAEREAFLRDAQSLVLEGATDLGRALTEASAPSWAVPGDRSAGPWDLFLLSDGASSWGEGDARGLAAGLRGAGSGALFAYTTGLAGTDTATLELLARATGGAVFSVVGAAEVASAAVAHKQRPWRIEELRLAGGRDLLLGGRPLNVFPGQVLRLAGRGRPRASDELVLVLSQDGRLNEVRTSLDAVLETELAARAFGEVAVAQLEELDPALADESRAFATHFRVTGKSCSLLMLETEAEYEQYGIVPKNDALVVRSTEVAFAVAETLRRMGDALGDPKGRFLAFLERLEAMPSIAFEVPAELRGLVGDLPSELFAVQTGSLGCRGWNVSDVPAVFTEALASGKPDYDALQAEAARRLEAFGAGDALRALSNLVELNPGDGVTARDVAFSVLELDLGEHAYHLFRRVAEARPFEPQTYHAMARGLADGGRADLALLWYEVALLGTWPGRYGAFDRIVSIEYLHFLRNAGDEAFDPALAGWARHRRAVLSDGLEPAEADLLVTILWNTDRTDVDLHVLEPTGERCYYSHPKTEIGGALTQDVTQGYGPEMYVLPAAVNGDYGIGAHYFSSDATRAGVRTKVYATVWRDWGRPTEQLVRKVVPLTEGGQMHDIGVLKIAK